MQEINVSGKHWIAPIQFRLMVKNVSVATYGDVDVVSGFGASILQVQQQPSRFSTLNTDDSDVSKKIERLYIL